MVIRLRDIGISLQRIRRCLAFLRNHFPEIEAPLAAVSLVTDGETIFTLTSDTDRLIDALREQIVWSVPISNLIQAARGEIQRATTQHDMIVTVDKRPFTVTVE